MATLYNPDGATGIKEWFAEIGSTNGAQLEWNVFAHYIQKLLGVDKVGLLRQCHALDLDHVRVRAKLNCGYFIDLCDFLTPEGCDPFVFSGGSSLKSELKQVERVLSSLNGPSARNVADTQAEVVAEACSSAENGFDSLSGAAANATREAMESNDELLAQTVSAEAQPAVESSAQHQRKRSREPDLSEMIEKTIDDKYGPEPALGYRDAHADGRKWDRPIYIKLPDNQTFWLHMSLDSTPRDVLRALYAKMGYAVQGNVIMAGRMWIKTSTRQGVLGIDEMILPCFQSKELCLYFIPVASTPSASTSGAGKSTDGHPPQLVEASDSDDSS